MNSATPSPSELVLLFRCCLDTHDGDHTAAARDVNLITDLLKIQEYQLLMRPSKGKRRFNKSLVQVLESRIDEQIIYNNYEK